MAGRQRSNEQPENRQRPIQRSQSMPELHAMAAATAGANTLPHFFNAKRNYVKNCDFRMCDEISKYEKLEKIGQSKFGTVFKGRDKNDNTKIVAMKEVLMEHKNEGFPLTALREIKLLQQLKHENMVSLLEVCSTKPTESNNYRSTFYLIFEYCEHNLSDLLANVKVKFAVEEIKKVMQQLLNGLYYIHSNDILHRDIKPANILITNYGVVKLGDFSVAHSISTPKNEMDDRYTNHVVTLSYRPPEILLGDRNYGTPVDMWGAGCILAELWTRSVIMPGTSEQQQLNLISQFCGPITPQAWPGVEELDLFKSIQFPKNQKRRLHERLRNYVSDEYGWDLMEKLLTLDPKKRIDADAALNHEFFWTDPLPIELLTMLSQHTQSMFCGPNQTTTIPQAQALDPKATVNLPFSGRIW